MFNDFFGDYVDSIRLSDVILLAQFFLLLTSPFLDLYIFLNFLNFIISARQNPLSGIYLVYFILQSAVRTRIFVHDPLHLRSVGYFCFKIRTIRIPFHHNLHFGSCFRRLTIRNLLKQILQIATQLKFFADHIPYLPFAQG